MNALLASPIRFDISELAQAMAQSSASDAMRCQFKIPHWEILGNYMQPLTLSNKQVLIDQGALDRTVYFIESGTVSVHYLDAASRIRMALVGAGTVLGEGAFFSHAPRRATVQASGPCKLWGLSPMRYLELTNRHPPIALELMTAMAAVMAKRLYNATKRVAVT